MDVQRINLVYFSPTRTTKKILEAIKSGFNPLNTTDVDLTLPAAENKNMEFDSRELVLIGIPVYAGRVPSDAARRLKEIRGNGSPAVIVVTYGNREFEDALLELKQLAIENGFKPIAGAAFICEHSFSTEEKPIAQGRPDKQDLNKAQQLGLEIRQKIEDFKSIPEGDALVVPGDAPYNRPLPALRTTPMALEDRCTECLDCAAVCPTGVIDASDPFKTNDSVCIHCCACVKNCPNGARVVVDEHIMQKADFLFTNFQARKEPEIFF